MDGKARRNLALFVAAFCYALIGIFIKRIGGEVPIMVVSFFRMFIGGLFLFLIMPCIDCTVFSRKTADIKDNILIGLLLAIATSAFNAAFLYASISRVNLIESSYIVFTVIFAYAFLGEQVGKKEIFAGAVGLFGIVLLHPGGQMKVMGFVLTLFSGLIYALTLVYIRKEEKCHTIGTVMWYLIFATLFLIPFPFIYGLGNATHHIWDLVGIGVLSTGLSYLLLNYALEELSADFTATFLIIFMPLIAIILAHILFNETVTGLELLGGGLLVFAGIILEIRKKPSLHIFHK